MGRKRFFAALWDVCRGGLITVLMFGAVAALVVFGLRSSREAQSEQALVMARESIMRAVVSCYAVEGQYPESYEYLRAHYGVAVDEEKYLIDYQIFASNILPDVTVIAR